MSKKLTFKFKHQAFQEEAVNALCDCFEGQPFVSAINGNRTC